jgi:hypothetical protein
MPPGIYKHHKLSQETKIKIGLAGKGKIRSQESKERISKAKKGKTIICRRGIKLSEEHKNKIRLGLLGKNKGRKLSEETKQKMSQSLRERWGNKEYKDKYGIGAVVGSTVASAASVIFAPARALAPDVTLADIRGAEWLLGAGQALAVAAVPFGGITGSIVGKLLDIGATTAFSIQTTLTWDELSAAGRVFNIATNIGSLVLPYAIGKLSKTANTIEKVKVVNGVDRIAFLGSSVVYITTLK